MFGNSSSFFQGCCWYVTNPEIQTWIRTHTKEIYGRHLMDNFLYELAIFFIDSSGFVFAKSLGMEGFQSQNPFNRWLGNTLFAWTQPLLKMAVVVNNKEPSSASGKSIPRMIIFLSLPYVLFFLIGTLVIVRRSRIGHNGLISYIFLFNCVMYSLLVVHFGNAVAFQRLVFMTNVIFNLTLYFGAFLVGSSFAHSKDKKLKQTAGKIS